MTPETTIKPQSITDQKNHALFDPVADTMRQIAPLKLHLYLEFGHDLSGDVQEIDLGAGAVRLKVEGRPERPYSTSVFPSFFHVVPMHSVVALSMEIQE